MQTSTGKMSAGLQENLSSYQFSQRGRKVAASSSTESPPSPSQSIRHQSPQTSNRQRPRLIVRPRSSGDTVRQKIKIQIIEENSDTRSAQSVDQKRTVTRETSEHLIGQPLSPYIPVKSLTGKEDNLLDTLDESTEPAPDRQKVSRPSWTRTRSGGVWYLRQRNTSSHENSSVRSTRSAAQDSEHSEPTSTSVVPLKPPARPQALQTSPTNHIVVEQPFGHDQDFSVGSAGALALSHTQDRRMSSIDVKRLFSAPLTILRRPWIDKTSKAPSVSPAQTQSSINLVNITSHNSLVAGDGTAANLQRVSSLLENYLRPTFIGRLRSCSHLTKSSTGSSDLDDSRQSRTRALIGAFHVPRSQSIGHLADNASSILNMHMGSTPQNSPTEKATYKIKRRPSAATEEFVKVDISIRGGTSYLPSEARRISTPPLPGNNRSGLRKGFFFDYNAPHFDDICGEEHVVSQYSRVEGPDHVNNHHIGNTGVVRSTSTKSQRSPSRKATSKTTTGDWYDTQLADLDTKTTEIDVTTPAEMEKYNQCKHECQARLAEIKRQRYEAQLDHSIPEHLPNSPLCPRNPKYWRVKQQKGSQFRGCWMHGYGEYDVVPGLYK